MEKDNIEKWLPLLKSLPFFSVFSDDELTTLLNTCDLRKYNSMEHIITQGEVSNTLYVILKGNVYVIKKTTLTKGPVKVNDLSAGNCFGEKSILLDKPRTAGVRAVGEVYIFRLTGEEIESFELKTQLKLFRQIAADLAIRLDETSTRLSE